MSVCVCARANLVGSVIVGVCQAISRHAELIRNKIFYAIYNDFEYISLKRLYSKSASSSRSRYFQCCLVKCRARLSAHVPFALHVSNRHMIYFALPFHISNYADQHFIYIWRDYDIRSRKISNTQYWDLDFISLWDLVGASTAVLPRRLSNVTAIGSNRHTLIKLKYFTILYCFRHVRPCFSLSTDILHKGCPPAPSHYSHQCWLFPSNRKKLHDNVLENTPLFAFQIMHIHCCGQNDGHFMQVSMFQKLIQGFVC